MATCRCGPPTPRIARSSVHVLGWEAPRAPEITFAGYVENLYGAFMTLDLEAWSLAKEPRSERRP